MSVSQSSSLSFQDQKEGPTPPEFIHPVIIDLFGHQVVVAQIASTDTRGRGVVFTGTVFSFFSSQFFFKKKM